MQIRYVGSKPTKEDNVAGTGTIWVGHGSVHEVPDKLWPLFAAHPNVWQRADGVIADGMPEPGSKEPEDKAPEFRFVAHDSSGTAVPLDAFEDAQLKAFAQVNRLEGVDLRKKGDALREAIVKATAKAEEVTEA